MEIGTLAFAAGVLAVHLLAALPGAAWTGLLGPLLLLAWGVPRVRVVALAASGLLWAVLHAQALLAQRLPASLEGCTVEITGRVHGLPQPGPRRTRFDLTVEEGRSPSCPGAAGAARQLRGARLRLSWYGAPARPASGERWRLAVRLHAPRGFANPGGFDYERHLLRAGIAATGYVRARPPPRRLTPGGWSIDRLRAALAARLATALGPSPSAGLAPALVLGLRGGLDGARWELLRATGTAHLVAISGLHVGLVAGLVLVVVRLAWSRSAWLTRRLAAPRAAAGAALLSALLYATLAGFALPTQRAVVMLAVFLGGRLVMRPVAPATGLGRALCAVLILDPGAPLGAGFWLSFVAVGVLLLRHAGRAQRPAGGRGVSGMLLTQLWIGVAMAPLMLLLYGRVALLAPLANAVAIPWIGILVVPLLLAGTVLIVPLPAAGVVLVRLAAALLDPLWPALRAIEALDPGWGVIGTPGPWALAGAALGVVLLAAPRGAPGRALAALLWLPVLLGGAPRPPRGGFELTVLDVGHGLSAVVRTARHVLVYDTGPRYGPGFDAGSAILVPYLRRLGAGRVDLLVLSHRDADHSGGTAGLRAALEIGATVAGDPGPGERACSAGQGWHWDGVVIEVLHPLRGERWGGNDRSCVVRIATGRDAVLLLGDLEADAERALTTRLGDRLRATLVVVPHHGSATSSSEELLDAVQPRYALISHAYRERARLPAGAVVRRYRARGAEIHDTAREGALRVVFDAGAPPRLLAGVRQAERHYWSAR